MFWNSFLGGGAVNWAFVGASTIAGQYFVGAVRVLRLNNMRWVISGAIFAEGVLSQEPRGEFNLITAAGAARTGFDRIALYQNALRNFGAAVAGRGRPAALGRAGVGLLQISFTVRNALHTGQRQAINDGETL